MVRGNRRLPTLHKYPGLELAGLDGELGFLPNIPGVDTSEIEKEIQAYLNQLFNQQIKPRLRSEAASAATETLKPYLIGVTAISLLALTASLVALGKSK
tara:strand:- start:58 stop:354 length:297 start_codon:yes stop_codon:yes gene_type:complete